MHSASPSMCTSKAPLDAAQHHHGVHAMSKSTAPNRLSAGSASSMDRAPLALARCKPRPPSAGEHMPAPHQMPSFHARFGNGTSMPLCPVPGPGPAGAQPCRQCSYRERRWHAEHRAHGDTAGCLVAHLPVAQHIIWQARGRPWTHSRCWPHGAHLTRRGRLALTKCRLDHCHIGREPGIQN